MFSPEFNQVYREAFASATGRDFSDEVIQLEYHRDTEQTVEALLERWTDPKFDSSPITDLREARRSQTFRIKHPETANFTEEDAADIAQVRFLGQQALRSARSALRENQEIAMDDSRKFEVVQWRDAHPDEKIDGSLGYFPDTPSPERLREWPEGEYVNCLGIAIATAAESENQDMEYVFMNRIRTASYEAATNAVQILERFDRMCPEALELEKMLHEFDGMIAEFNGEDEESIIRKESCIRDNKFLEYIFLHAENVDTSFHHAVIRRNEEINEQASSWQQFDPYGLIYADITPSLLDDTLSSDRLIHELGVCNEILLLDGDVQNNDSRSMANAITVALRSKRRLEKIFEGYESPDIMNTLKIELERSRQAILFRAIPAEEPVNSLSDDFIFNQNIQLDLPGSSPIWINILGKAVESNPTAFMSYFGAFRGFKNRREKALASGNDFKEDLGEVLSKKVFSLLKDDSSLQMEFEKIILAMPFAYALHFAEERIKEGLFDGESEKAMEVGDAAFQIGSMYLNHYARWKNDGIVNVASELARVNPSQLIWQSAISQEEGIIDDRVAAVGALVKSFKRGQKHPLVALTR